MRKKILFGIIIGCSICVVSLCLKQTKNEISNFHTKQTTEKTAEKTTEKNTEKIDVDLSKMSEQLAYAKVMSILGNPYDYIDKKIKIKGKLISYDVGNAIYYTCSVTDNVECTCCPSGLEFTLKEGLEYPKENEEFTVIGTFDSYLDSEMNTYFRVKDCEYVK